MHFGLLQRHGEGQGEKIWFATFILYVAIIGALFVVFRVHATPTITVCASGCDYTNITTAVTDATLSGGGTVSVQATYDPTGEPSYPSAVIAPSYTNTAIDCQNSGAYIGVLDPTATTTISMISGDSLNNCNVRNTLVNAHVVLDGDITTGATISGNTFDPSSWSLLTLQYFSGPLIQNNTGHFTIDIAWSVAPIIDGNTMTGEMNFNSVVLVTRGAMPQGTITNNHFTIDGFNNIWWNFSGGSLNFSSNTVEFVGTAPVGFDELAFGGGDFIVDGNYFNFGYTQTTGLSYIAFFGGLGGEHDHVEFKHNTVVSTVAMGSMVGFSTAYGGSLSADIEYNLFYNKQVASVGDGGVQALNFRNESGGSYIITNHANGMYGFGEPMGYYAPAYVTLDSYDRLDNPHLRLENVSTSDDMEPAPWSDYFDVDGTEDIGAYSGVRRSNVYIDAAGTVDYNTVDATNTDSILATNGGLANGDTVHIAAGQYTAGIFSSSTGMASGLTIVGSGSGIGGGPETNISCLDLSHDTQFNGIDSLSISHIKFDDRTCGGLWGPTVTINNAQNAAFSDIQVVKTTGSAPDGLGLNAVTNSTFTDIATAGFTSSTLPSYMLSNTAYQYGGHNYSDGASIGWHTSTTLALGGGNNSGCDAKAFETATSVTEAILNDGHLVLPESWHLALIRVPTQGNARLTMWMPNHVASDAGTVEALCSDAGVVVDKFISNAFTFSGQDFTYNSAAIASAGATIISGFDSPAALTRTKVVNGAGIGMNDSGGNTFTNITSTGNTCGVGFAGSSGSNSGNANLFYNYVASASLEYDICSNANPGNYNEFFIPTLSSVPASYSSVATSPALMYNTRARILDTYSTPIAGATVTIADIGATSSTLMTTDGSGYTPYSGLFAAGQYTISVAAIGGLYATSTRSELVSQNQTFTVYMTSTTPPVTPPPPCTNCNGSGPPQTVTPIISSFGINSGATTTASTTVTLGIVANTATQMVFSLNDSFANTVWQAYSQTSSFLLDSALGLKHIYAKVRGSDGGESAVSVQNITLVAESTPQRPVTAPTISAPAYATSTEVLLTIGYDDTASQMMLSNSANFVGSEWEPLAPNKVWKLPAPDGQKTIYIKVRSGTGTESSTVVATLILDATAPATPVITTPKNNEKLTNGAITISGSADPHEPFVLTLSSNQKEVVHVTFPISAQGAWSYAVPDALPVGSYQILARSTDIAGNQSEDFSNFTILASEPAIPLMVSFPSDGTTISKNIFVANGSGKAGAHIVVVQGTATFTSVIGTNGKWSIPISLAAVSDTYAFEYRMVDAGNNLLDSVQRSVVVDLPVVPPPPDKKVIDTTTVTAPGGTAAPAPAPGGATLVIETPTSTSQIVTSAEQVVVTTSTEPAVVTTTAAQFIAAAEPIQAAVDAVKKVSARVTKTAAAAQRIAQAPEVQIANQAVVVPAAAAVVAAGVSTSLNLGQIALYFRFLFTQPLFLLTRKRRKGWGMAYNAISKLPADLALVRIINADSGRVVQSHVTDRDGRYQFFARPGNYRIEVDKPNFSFPAAYMAGKTEDGQLADLYTGGTVPLTAAAQISYNLPLDPGGEHKDVSEILHAKNKSRLVNILGAGGVVLTAVSFAVSPTIFVGAFLAAQVVSYFVFRRLAITKKPKDWGVIKDASGAAVANAIVRVFDTQYNKLLETQITGNDGRYSFLVGSNQYYVMAEKPGYQTVTTEPITINAPEGGASLAKDVTLQMQGA